MHLEVVMRGEIAAGIAADVVLVLAMCADSAEQRGALKLARAQAMAHECWPDVVAQVRAAMPDALKMLEG